MQADKQEGNAPSRLGLVGRKVGMTRVFTDDGASVAVTVIDVSNNRVAQVKNTDNDGYEAVQLAYGVNKPSRLSKPLSGHLAKAKVESAQRLKEFHLSGEQTGKFAPGQVLGAAMFSAGQKVDVQGVTIGKGFAGTIKRHHFGSQRASHGNSRSHNVPGSISMAQDPGRVFPGKRMSGHLGNVVRTTQNLTIARVDETRNLLLVQGAIPGARGHTVIVRPAVKVVAKAEAKRAA